MGRRLGQRHSRRVRIGQGARRQNLKAIAGAFIILFTAVNADQIRWREEMIGEFVALFPSWLDSTLALIYVLGGLYTFLIIVLAGVGGGRRLGLFRALPDRLVRRGTRP